MHHLSEKDTTTFVTYPRFVVMIKSNNFQFETEINFVSQKS